MVLKGGNVWSYPGLHIVDIVHVQRGWIRGVTFIDKNSQGFEGCGILELLLQTFRNSAKHLLENNIFPIVQRYKYSFTVPFVQKMSFDD